MYHSRTNERYGVSTHGSLAGADSTDNASFNSILAVSTHGSLAGADCRHEKRDAAAIPFQLTAPLREPTLYFSPKTACASFQLTAPLREPTIVAI